MRLLPFIALLAAIPCTVLVWLKGRRIAAVRRGPWIAVPWLGVIAFVPAVAGPVWSIVRLVGTFRSIAGAPQAEKAQMLSRGIADSVSVGQVPAAVAMALYLLAFVLIGYATAEEDEDTTS